MKVGVGACALMFVVVPATAIAQFTDWSAPVNLGPPVNSPEYTESCVAISKNGLSLFFSSNRQTGIQYSPDRDLYVSKRDSIEDPWGDPQSLTTLNTTAWESCPALSLDEHRLYFTSPRPGGCGGRTSGCHAGRTAVTTWGGKHLSILAAQRMATSTARQPT